VDSFDIREVEYQVYNEPIVRNNVVGGDGTVLIHKDGNRRRVLLMFVHMNLFSYAEFRRDAFDSCKLAETT
jgi:hypothetical protein